VIIATGVRSPSHAESEYDGNEYAALPVDCRIFVIGLWHNCPPALTPLCAFKCQVLGFSPAVGNRIQVHAEVFDTGTGVFPVKESVRF
jgi:hypothetical protein